MATEVQAKCMLHKLNLIPVLLFLTQLLITVKQNVGKTEDVLSVNNGNSSEICDKYKTMIFVLLLALAGLTLSGVAIYYSVIGLTAIFAAAFWPIVIMGTTLEVSKLVAASWLKARWEVIPGFMKTYMLTAVIVLMLITSMGIFGFLSKAH